MQGDILMDKKYILAKDLPFEKKGIEVRVNKSGIYIQRKNFYPYEVYIDALRFSESTSENIQKELQRLIDEGWIEEVKPREFLLHFKKSNGEVYSIQDLTTRKEYNGISNFDGEGVDSIKVREVLE